MSKTWLDNKGEKWTADMTVGAVKRIRNLTGLNIAQIGGEANPLETLANDIILFVDVLYALHKPEADKRGITDEQFAELLSGDAIENAMNAFVEALIDFFPNPLVREGMRKSLEESRRKAAEQTS